MRVGAHVFHYHSAEEWAREHVRKEYGTAYWPLALTSSPQEIEAYAAAAKEHHLLIAEVGAWNNLLDRDPSVREANILDNIQALRLADQVGARCCVNITGSYANTWDGADPRNLTEDTFQLIVKTIQRIIDEAKPKNACYTVEPMPWLYPNSIESMRRLLREVHREEFAVHADMCNLLNSFEKVCGNGDYTRAFFAEFGDRIQSVHAKDTVIDTCLTLCIREAIPGAGLFDYPALLSECAKLDADLPIMTEHLQTEPEYLQATGFLLSQIKEAGHPLRRSV